uniref:SGF29 C-terminal domain-containing protein n=1 Tax=Panagrellus redivivus TaxID=6233 RepID=A0A7E4ZPW0_PANRE
MGTADKKFTKRQIEWFWQQDAKVQRNAKRIAKWVPPLKKNNEDFDAIMIKYDREYRNLGLTDKPLDTLSKQERNKLLAMNLRQLYLLQKQMKPLRSAYKYATRMSDAKEKMTLQFDQTRKSLNKMIRQSGELLPLWVGLPGEYPPERCCRIPSKDKPKRGELAPAYVNDMWILAEVMSVDEESNTVVVRDIDEDGGMFRVYTEQVILLPKYRLDPLRYPDAIFPVDAVVYGLYPQTTCFYKGIVSNPPLKDTDDYFVTFEDEEYDGLFAPEVRVPQRFIVPFKEVPKRTLCESVKELEDNDIVEEFKINDIIDQEDRYGSSKATKRRLPEALREKTPEVVELSSSDDEDVTMESVDDPGKQKAVTDSDVIILTDSEAAVEAVPKVIEIDSDVNMEAEPENVLNTAPSVAEVQPEKVTETVTDVSMEDVFETSSESASRVSSKASSALSTHTRSIAEAVSQGTVRDAAQVAAPASTVNMDDVFETSSEASSVVTVVQPSNVNTTVVSNINMDDVFETNSDPSSRGNSRVASVASLKAPSVGSSKVAPAANVAVASVVSSRASSIVHSEAASHVTTDSDVVILSDSETVAKTHLSVPEAVNTTSNDAGKRSSRAVSEVSTEAESEARKATPEVITLSDSSEDSEAESDVIEVESNATLEPASSENMEVESAVDSEHRSISPPETAASPMSVDASLQEDEVESQSPSQSNASREQSHEERGSTLSSEKSATPEQPIEEQASSEETSSGGSQSRKSSSASASEVAEDQSQSGSSHKTLPEEPQDDAASVQFLYEAPAPVYFFPPAVPAPVEPDNLAYLFDENVDDMPLVFNRDQQRDVDFLIKMKARDPSLLPEEVMQGIENLNFKHRIAYDGAAKIAPPTVVEKEIPNNEELAEDNDEEDEDYEYDEEELYQDNYDDEEDSYISEDEDEMEEDIEGGEELENDVNGELKEDNKGDAAANDADIAMEISDDGREADAEKESSHVQKESGHNANIGSTALNFEREKEPSHDQNDTEHHSDAGSTRCSSKHEKESKTGSRQSSHSKESRKSSSHKEASTSGRDSESRNDNIQRTFSHSTASHSRQSADVEMISPSSGHRPQLPSSASSKRGSPAVIVCQSTTSQASPVSSDSRPRDQSSTDSDLEPNDTPSEDEVMETEDANDNENDDEAEDEEESADDDAPIKDYHTDCSESSTDVQSDSDDDDIPEAPYDSDEIVELSNGSDDYDSEYDEERAESPNPADSGNKISEQEFETTPFVEDHEVIELLSDASVVTLENTEKEVESAVSEDHQSEHELMSDDQMSDQHSIRSECESSHASTLVADTNSRTPIAEAATDESVVIRTPTPESQRLSTLTPEPTEEWPETATPQLLETSPSQSPAATPQPQTSTETPPVLTPAQSPPIEKTPEPETTPMGSPFRIDQTGYSYILEPPPPPPLLLPFASGQSSYIVPPPPPPPPLEDYNPEDRRSVPMDVDTPSPGHPGNTNHDQYNA